MVFGPEGAILPIDIGVVDRRRQPKYQFIRFNLVLHEKGLSRIHVRENPVPWKL